MERETVRDQVRRIAEEARAASGALAQTSADERNGALASMAAALRSHAAAIVEANGCDMDAARKAGTKEGLLDRLMLDEGRVEAMAAALEDLVALPDPLGAVQQKRTLESGIELQRVSVPLGVVAVVYEARPNVTADAAGICLKSGNAAVLRGGSMAAASNEVIARVLHEAAVEAGMPRGGRRAHAAARCGGRAHPARRSGPHPPLRGDVEGAGHRDGHGQLPRVRARERRLR